MKTGTRLGPYEIFSAIGVGGMGSACGCGERAKRVEPPRAGVGPREQLKKVGEGDLAQWPC